jgi:serine O-acetyltransferase
VLWWPVLLVGWVPYLLLAAFMRFGYGIDLRSSAQIGPGLYIGHFGGIRVADCRIGSGCSIAQQCQIGPAGAAGPLIGDRVWVGAHARVLGAISVGDGVTISAGCHITRDLPARVLVVGNPARITMRDYDNSRLL